MTREETIRKIRHQAFRRSTLELELLLSRLTNTGALSQFTNDELKHLSVVLDLDDLELQKALLTRGPAPAGASPVLWARLLALIVPKFEIE
ncbi:MAG: succinate dehydrogenase assembly factor 2 [Deltaproteobacteria bacterium]|nr:succinate dehydrogenase assembly factor 2 [Deltaproteobacteria bacterium]